MITDSQFADLAGLTYSRPATWTGITDPKHVHDQSVQAFLDDGDSDIVTVGFRGSKTPVEWMLDFLAMAVIDHKTTEHAKLGAVHLGFLLAAGTLYPKVRDAASGSASKKRPFALYGHSLGGALALMSGALLMSDGIPVARIVTFGAPRVGLSDYVRMLAPVAIDEYRFGNDIVPQVPGYLEHARDLIRIGTPRIDFISCHHVENYQNAVAALDAAAA